MARFNVGDYVLFLSDFRLGRRDNVFVVLAYSPVYDMVRLRNRKTGVIISWYPAHDVRKVEFYQPELIRVEV